MRSTYEIKKEMENNLGKDFLKKLESQKEEYERLSKELKYAEDFENKIQVKQEKLGKYFVYISDNYNIYPEETRSNKLYVLAKDLVSNNYTDKEEKETIKQYEQECLDEIESDCKSLLEEIKRLRE